MARKPKAPETAAQSPLVALAELAREADASHAVIVYREADGTRRWAAFESMTALETAGLLAMAVRDLAEADLPDEEDE
jgi:hypothetical protein